MKEMTPKIAEARYAGDYRIWFRFADGVEGEVDLEPELWGEMFEPLKDKALFVRFELYPERSTIFWPNAADFAPEFLYEKVRHRVGINRPPSSSEGEPNFNPRPSSARR